jgi:uncharacterized membrane protein YbhN (UPF0104 family)
MSPRAAAVFAAKLALSVALLVVVLAKVDVGAILQVLAGADVALVTLWYLLVPAAIALGAWRWKILAPGLGLGTAFKYTWIGVFYGSVLPGGISGDVAKGVSLALKDAGARAGLAASIVADKGIGLAVLLVFFDAACAVAYAMHGEASGQIRHLAMLALVLSVLALAGLAAAIVALRRGWLEARGRPGALGRLFDGVGSAARWYADKPDRLWRAVAISVAVHAVNIAALYAGFRAIHVDAGLLAAAMIYPVLSVLLVVPVSISGIGVRDATLAVFFVLFGLPAASGVALSWLVLLSLVPNVAVGAAIQVAEMYRRPK